MRVKKHNEYFCDICGNQISPHIFSPFHFRYFSKTQFRKSKRMDICDDCRVAMLEWINSRRSK